MVTIADLEASSLDLVATWLSAHSVNRWLTSHWRERDITASTIAIALRNRRNRLYLVCVDGAPSGLVALAEIDASDQSAELWYALAPEAPKGRGTATQAVELVVEQAFEVLALRCLYLNIMANNVASLRVAEKTGFRHAGRLRKAMTFEGTPVDRVLYDLLPEDRAPAHG